MTNTVHYLFIYLFDTPCCVVVYFVEKHNTNSVSVVQSKFQWLIRDVLEACRMQTIKHDRIVLRFTLCIGRYKYLDNIHILKNLLTHGNYIISDVM